MATLAEIYNVRANLIAAVTALYADYQVLALTGPDDPMEPPCLGVEWREAGDNLHRYPVPSGTLAGQRLRDMFEGDLVLTVVTRRDETDHSAMVADVLALLPDTGDVLSDYLATWYGIGLWQVSGTDTTTDDATRFDRTSITIRVVLGVLPGAWPA